MEKIAEDNPAMDSTVVTTQFQTTIFYHPTSVFETAIACLSLNAQAYQIDSNSSYSTAAAACKYLSPEVLIFGDEFEWDDLLKFLDRGFQVIHIYTVSDKYKNIDSDNLRIVTFGEDTLYDHIILTHGVIDVYLLEHIIAIEKPNNYVSELNSEITKSAGERLIDGIKFRNKALDEVLLQISNSPRCFDILQDYITFGAAAREINKQNICKKFHTGIFTQLGGTQIYAINAEYDDEILKIAHTATSNMQNSVIMIYSVEPLTIETDGILKRVPGWRVVLVNISECIDAEGIFEQLNIDAFTINDKAFTAWITPAQAAALLPFLYE